MGERIIFDPAESGKEDAGSVISLADVRIARGWTRPSKQCAHKSMVYSINDRRIECKDCDQPIEAFDAFAALCAHFDSMERAARSREHKTKAALDAVIIRRAAKEIDRKWSKMAPLCPHCRGGLLPEDFANGSSAIGIDLERARRARPQHKEEDRPAMIDHVLGGGDG